VIDTVGTGQDDVNTVCAEYFNRFRRHQHRACLS
jgi:hypothetical protein